MYQTLSDKKELLPTADIVVAEHSSLMIISRGHLIRIVCGNKHVILAHHKVPDIYPTVQCSLASLKYWNRRSTRMPLLTPDTVTHLGG